VSHANGVGVLAVLALAVAGTACSHTRPAKAVSSSDTARIAQDTASVSPRAMPSETVLTGKVGAVGLAMAPVTSLQIEGARAMTLVGPLEPELRRLGGATVWVTGSPVSGAPNATFSVTRYDIVSIDGAKPIVGVVMTRDGATWLATESDTVKLGKAPAALAAKNGAKVWVVVRRSGDELTTQTYGVIREP
jgi:hypothetical protein